jgi:hypothetical protein
MKRLVSVLLMFIVSVNCFAQKKIPVKSSGTSEIDNLYKKYKDSKTITLYTSYGNLEGVIGIEFNDENKPISVGISGETTSEQSLQDFLENTIKMKLKQGYRSDAGTDVTYMLNYARTNFDGRLKEVGTESEREIFLYGEKGPDAVFLMKKGSMYFKICMNTCMQSDKGNIPKTYWVKGCFYWHIETGDMKRRASKNSTNFEF